MKQTMTLVAAAALLVGALSACSGGGSKSDCKLFGTIPGIYAEAIKDKDALKEELKNTDDWTKVQEKADKLEAKYTKEIEDAANAWSGTALDIQSDENFKVVTPVVATFKDFSSKSDITARFTLAGDVEAARDIPIEGSESLAEYYGKYTEKTPAGNQVKLVCLDAEGNELFDTPFGYAMPKVGDGVLVIPAGSKVQLESLTYSPKQTENYPKIATMKLELKKIK